MRRVVLAVLGSFALAVPSARAETATYDEAPIRYSDSQPHDPVARLKERMDKGEVTLDYSSQRGYLKSLLRELKIPISSQTLVFSKTSFQRKRISPQNPRAIYFDDDTYVGFVPGGDVLEIATTDPALGTIFYTLDQQPPDSGPRALVRQTDNCLECHAGSNTRDIPGLLVRSTYPDAHGQPILSAGTFLTTHQSPLKERWGGWYVTGLKSDGGSLANMVFGEQDGPGAKPAGSADLKQTKEFLSPRSDPVALLVLAHQVEAHNRFTRAAYAAARALRDEKVLQDALGEKPEPGLHSDSTLNRVKSGCDPLVEYLLFSGEAPLDVAIPAGSPFAAEFAARGPKDSRGRSLRDFDLKSRLFRYPCSYLIYSSAFDELPEVAREYVYHRIFDVLTGKDATPAFAHLAPADRQAILEILRDTKHDLPTYWATAK